MKPFSASSRGRAARGRAAAVTSCATTSSSWTWPAGPARRALATAQAEGGDGDREAGVASRVGDGHSLGAPCTTRCRLPSATQRTRRRRSSCAQPAPRSRRSPPTSARCGRPTRRRSRRRCCTRRTRPCAAPRPTPRSAPCAALWPRTLRPRRAPLRGSRSARPRCWSAIRAVSGTSSRPTRSSTTRTDAA